MGIGRWFGVLLSGGLLVGSPRAQAEDGPASSSYVKGLEQRCARRWTNNFVEMAEHQLPKTHPVNRQDLVTTLEVTADPTGKVLATDVAGPSGVAELDSAAVDVVKDSAPLGRPRSQDLSDDGNVHVRWRFARADGRCSDIEIFQKESPLDVALPRLIGAKRDDVAWNRVARAASEPGMSLYARLILERARTNQKDPTVLAALTRLGDKPAAEALAALVATGKVPATFAPRVVDAGVSFCPLLKDKLATTGKERDLALTLLAYKNEAPCVAPVVALAENPATPQPTRLAALRALGNAEGDGVRKTLLAALDDPARAVKVAAITALGRPGGGRPVLFRVTPFLRDPAVEIRTAAGATLVRAVGEPAVEQLYLIWKENDPRPFEAVAPELGQLSSQASAEMLGRFLKRDDLRIRTAGAAALAGRRDAFARAALAAATKDAQPAVRVFALPALPAPTRAATAAASPDPRAYDALLRSGERDAAATWLIAQWPHLDAPARLDALAAFLATSTDPKLATRP